jgi:glutamate racemase
LNKQSPIVVLDSGLGGLTVVRSLRQALPAEDLVYFGDTARLPYGSKTASVVTTFVSQIIRYLQPLEPKHVVIACNTATALSLPDVRAEFPSLTITGVIEAGAQAAVEAVGAIEEPMIGVIATEATVRSQAYEKAIHKRRMKARVLLQPAPLLVPIIEDGRMDADPLVQLAVRQYLTPLTTRGIDALVLGCTHYPILRGLIEETVGPKVAVVDSADHCAHEVLRKLESAGLRREVSEPTRGTLRCWVTDDGPRFTRLASRFLGYEIPRPTWINPDELPNARAELVDVRSVG